MILDVIPVATRVRCAKLVAVAGALYAFLWLAGFQKHFQNDTEGVATLLQVIGTLYSVLYAFATYVIWGQFTSVENEIRKESGALKDLLIFSQGLKEAVREPMVRAVKTYARAVVETEWGALAAAERTEKTNRLFNDVVGAVTAVNAEGNRERAVYERLLDIANQASTHRDERLSVSLKRMPRTLFSFVILTAGMILFLLLFYPFRNLALGIVAVGITTMLLFLAYFVLIDLDNPFEGTWNATCDPFGELITGFR